MKRLVVDIETVGEDFDYLDEASKEFMLKYAEDEQDEAMVKESLSFYPLTAQVVAIGALDVQTNNLKVFFQAPNSDIKDFKEGGNDFFKGDEKQILELFWKELAKYDQIITFNGRGFDAPFLMVRSAIRKVKPTKNLMPNRYSSDMHIDLLDRLTFYGSVRRKFNLHMWCRAFGIKSPKEEGVTGYQVKDMFKEGKFVEIAKYCAGDLLATRELFEYWDKYIKV